MKLSFPLAVCFNLLLLASSPAADNGAPRPVDKMSDVDVLIEFFLHLKNGALPDDLSPKRDDWDEIDQVVQFMKDTNRLPPDTPKSVVAEARELLQGIRDGGGKLTADSPLVIKSRQKAARSHCLGQMRQIMLALKAFANDDVEKQRFPPNLGVLVEQEYISAKHLRVFIDPCNTKPPKIEKASEVDANTDFIYETPGITDDGSDDIIVLYCKGHEGEGRNVFFVDGHGKWYKEDEFQKLLAEQRKKFRK